MCRSTFPSHPPADSEGSDKPPWRPGTAIPRHAILPSCAELLPPRISGFESLPSDPDGPLSKHGTNPSPPGGTPFPVSEDLPLLFGRIRLRSPFSGFFGPVQRSLAEANGVSPLPPSTSIASPQWRLRFGSSEPKSPLPFLEGLSDSLWLLLLFPKARYTPAGQTGVRSPSSPFESLCTLLPFSPAVPGSRSDASLRQCCLGCEE